MAISITHTDTDFINSANTTFNHTSISIGTASADRIVVVVAQGESPNSISTLLQATDCTIAGVTATRAVFTDHGVPSAIFWAEVPTGTSGTVSVTYEAQMNRNHIGVYSLTGADPSVSDTDTFTSASGTGGSFSVDIPANAVAICGYASGVNVTHAWSGASEDYDEQMGGASTTQGSGAHVDATGSDRNGHSITISHSNSSQATSGVVAVFPLAGEGPPPPPPDPVRLTGADNSSLAWSTVDADPGDLVLVFFANDGGDNQSTPSDLTRIGTDIAGAVGGGVYYRIVDGSESGNLITNEGTFGISNEEYCWHVIKIPVGAWDGETAPELQADNGTDGSGAGTINPPTLTPSWGEADTLWIVAAARDDDDGISSFGADYATNFEYTQSASSTGSCELVTSWRRNTAASENPGTATQTNTNEGWIAWTVGVRPFVDLGEQHSATGTISLDVSATGDSEKSGETTGILDVAVSGSGNSEKAGEASGDLELILDGSGDTTKAAAATSDLTLTVTQDGTAAKGVTSTSDFQFSGTLSGASEKAGEADSSLSLALSAPGDAVKEESNDKSASTTLELVVLGSGTAEKAGSAATSTSLSIDFDQNDAQKGVLAASALDLTLSEAGNSEKSVNSASEVALGLENSADGQKSAQNSADIALEVSVDSSSELNLASTASLSLETGFSSLDAQKTAASASQLALVLDGDSDAVKSGSAASTFVLELPIAATSDLKASSTSASVVLLINFTSDGVAELDAVYFIENAAVSPYGTARTCQSYSLGGTLLTDTETTGLVAINQENTIEAVK